MWAKGTDHLPHSFKANSSTPAKHREGNNSYGHSPGAFSLVIFTANLKFAKKSPFPDEVSDDINPGSPDLIQKKFWKKSKKVAFKYPLERGRTNPSVSQSEPDGN